MTMRPTLDLPIRRVALPPGERRPSARLEWLVTNGLGGYACGTVAGHVTRRYHGPLVAALPTPLGRTHYASHLRASLRVGTDDIVIDHEDAGRLAQPDVASIVDFHLEGGLPVWRYRTGGVVIEKRIARMSRANTTIVRYRLIGSAAPCRLRLTPLLQVRPHDSQSPVISPDDMTITAGGGVWRLGLGDVMPALFWTAAGTVAGSDFTAPVDTTLEYAVERERGYAHAGVLWFPGSIDLMVEEERGADFVLSTEGAEVVASLDVADAYAREVTRRVTLVLASCHASPSLIAELTLAADQFLITPVSRPRDRAHERSGDRTCTVIAGYHWFTDWGRDTMISLEGLTLCTGRAEEGAAILRTFARYVRDGLIPNLFPEGEQEGLYHTADATLWFVHAIGRYVARTGDRTVVDDLLPTVQDILEHHLHGTRFGIAVDQTDGLLTQGAEHYQLTWMDAKAGDWVVTPRRGKAVEINALWYNALRLAAQWLSDAERPDAASRYREAADRVYVSFNQRFWHEPANHLFDVIDGEHGNDAACRPNQLLAVALPHAVLEPVRWPAVVETVRNRLLTPVGLRSLAPGHPDYQRQYFGDLRTRDAAYHQGTVWAWLIGPFVDAWLKTYPDDPGPAATALSGFDAHLSDACVGSISEIFDAEAPFAARGCVAQAWSVAEVLRSLLRVSEHSTSESRQVTSPTPAAVHTR